MGRGSVAHPTCSAGERGRGSPPPGLPLKFAFHSAVLLTGEKKILREKNLQNSSYVCLCGLESVEASMLWD